MIVFLNKENAIKRYISCDILPLVQLSEELKIAKESERKTESPAQEAEEEGKTVKEEMDTKTSKPEEEGEIDEGEETSSTKKSADAELKELRANLKWVLTAIGMLEV